jgi:hypothetical protein
VFSGLANKSFNVFEGVTAIAGLDGFIVGDPTLHLTDMTILPGQSQNGFIGNSPPLPVPEPASIALLSTALATFAIARRRRSVSR